MEDIIETCNLTVKFSKFTSKYQYKKKFGRFGEKPFPIIKALNRLLDNKSIPSPKNEIIN